MKIKRINLKEFGKYSGGKNIFEFSDGINLIVGSNESGKSTMFNGMLSVLYGFRPADREKNIFVNWESEKIEIESEIFFQNKKYDIYRRLLSSPRGNLYYDGKNVDIGNNPLFFLGGIGRETFKSVYFLNAYDMTKINDSSWNEIEDRLIMNSGISSLMLTRDVLSGINDEMREIYKTRGNSLIKSKKNEILELKRKRKDLLLEMEALKEKIAERDLLNESISKTSKEVSEIERNLSYTEKLKPIVRIINNFKNMDSKIYEFERLFGDNTEEIEENIKACRDYIKETELHENKDDEVKIQREKFFAKYQEIFCESFDDSSIERIKSLNFTNLNVIFRKISELKLDIANISEVKQEKTSRKSGVRLLFGLLFAAAGSGIFYMKLFQNYAFMYQAAIFFISAGVILILDSLVFLARVRKKTLEKLLDSKKNEISESLNILKKEIGNEINTQLIFSSPLDFFSEIEKLKEIAIRVPVKGNTAFDLFSKLGNGDYKKGIEAFEEYLKNLQRKDFISEELEKNDSSYEMRNIIDSMEDEAFMAILNSDADEINDKLNKSKKVLSEKQIEIIKVDKDIESIEEKLGQSDLDETIELREVELEELFERFDQLTVIRKIIEFFDQKYRDENQPKVLRDAGYYMNLITGSKYSRIYSEENRINDIMIKSSSKIEMPENGYSRGTSDQAYMAFRLAVAKSLDSKGEKFPLFLDEAFINWDGLRFDRALKIVKSISEHRQIFVFTCHRWVANQIQKNLDCKTIEIT